jgi:MiaB/RimO family radical SAM methylthiotransferase
MVAFGCLAGINPEALREHGDLLTLPPSSIDRLDEVIGAEVKLGDVKPPNTVGAYVQDCSRCFGAVDKLGMKLGLWKDIAHRAWLRARGGDGPNLLHTRYDHVFDITIAKGCNGECTYCAIRFATGPTRSKPIENVLAEFREGLAEGHTVFRLNAGDVGAYGQDVGSSIVELFRRIFSCEGSYKVIFDDFNPRWLIRYCPELLDVFAASADRLGYAGLPIQSGSERIIRLMRRGHTVADVERCLLKLREALPKLDIATHVLIGFPGESERDFLDTVELVRKVGFRHVQTYAYSDRPRTMAATLPNKVPEKVKDQRRLRFRRWFPESCQVI